MKRRIFKKYIFYQPRVYAGIDYISRLLVIVKRYVVLNHYQGSGLRL